MKRIKCQNDYYNGINNNALDKCLGGAFDIICGVTLKLLLW